MIKRVSLVRRLPELTPDEFVAHWSGAHVEIARRLPGVRGIRLGVVQTWNPAESAWDGIGELWFDSREAADAAFAAEPVANQLAADRKLFLGEAQVAFVDEVTVLAPPERR